MVALFMTGAGPVTRLLAVPPPPHPGLVTTNSSTAQSASLPAPRAGVPLVIDLMFILVISPGPSLSTIQAEAARASLAGGLMP